MPDVLLFLIILCSVILHEVSHAVAAYLLGDSTAKDEGRITLNPIPHISVVGTILLPILFLSSNTGILFGWAKPVPYNPYNLRWKYGDPLVAFSGPLMNLFIVFVFVLIYHFTPVSESALLIIAYVVQANLFLAFFNLLPIPPLDGYKTFSFLLPLKYRMRLETSFFSSDLRGLASLLVIFLIFVLFLAEPFFGIIKYLTKLLL